MASTLPTFVVQLTPPGRGAVAVVLISGPLAISTVDVPFFAANGSPLDKQAIGRILYGRWDAPTRNRFKNGPLTTAASSGRRILVGEELVVCLRAPDRVEVHPHGGVASVRAVIEDLINAGCTHLDWKKWATHNEPDPIRAAAQIALAIAPTERTAAILLDQWQGALHRAMEEITEGRLSIDSLLARAELGRHLTEPWRVVLAGRPNVGKSSLVNAILGYQRSITFDRPGTTRDVVTATTAIDGWPIELSDTAGLREGGDAIEIAGVELAQRQLADSDLVVWIDEVSEIGMWNMESGKRSEVYRLWKAGQGKRTLHVVNKIDLLNPSSRLAVVGLENSSSILTSAKTGEGIYGLLEAIAKRLVPTSPPLGAAVPFTEAQVEMITALEQR